MKAITSQKACAGAKKELTAMQEQIADLVRRRDASREAFNLAIETIHEQMEAKRQAIIAFESRLHVADDQLPIEAAR